MKIINEYYLLKYQWEIEPDTYTSHYYSYETFKEAKEVQQNCKDATGDDLIICKVVITNVEEDKL